MPTIPIPAGDYWHLRFLQERAAHAKTTGLLGELRAVQAHAEAFSTLTRTYPILATAETWTFTDADLTLSAPDPPPGTP